MSTETCSVTVQSEFDIVNLRHTVRQMARTAGLDMTRQAKVTVAISALARGFLTYQDDVQFVVHLSRDVRPLLEIACLSSNAHHAHSGEQLEAMLNLQEIHLLVDEFRIKVVDNTAHLLMRIWLESGNSPARKRVC